LIGSERFRFDWRDSLEIILHVNISLQGGKSMKRASKITSFFLFPIVVFLIHLVVKALGGYEMLPAIDIPFHYIGGLSIAYTVSQILSYFESEKITAELNKAIFLALLLSLTATAAVSWEFAEFISDRFLHTNLQPSNANTMQDQFLGILGGGTWAAIYLRRAWRASRLQDHKKRA
jgi:hypothetical protein